MSNNDVHCPPYRAPVPYVRPDGRPPTILDLASVASHAADVYRRSMNDRRPFDEVLRAAGALARATEQLATLISDQVAEGDGRLD